MSAHLRVRLTSLDGSSEEFDADTVAVDAGRLIVETTPDRRRLEFPLDELEAWSVRKPDGEWERHDAGEHTADGLKRGAR